MSKLNDLIAKWRNGLAADSNMPPESLEELENHLRDAIAPLLRKGFEEREAFLKAVEQLGTTPALTAEFRKLETRVWLPVKVTAGIGIALAPFLAVMLVVHFRNRPLGWLLDCHVFTFTLGYITALLTGVLGMCFAWQRYYMPFSPRRQQDLARTTTWFTLVAACLTGTGIILGSVWSHAKLGHWWQWDAKETPAFCVMVWLVCFSIIHQIRAVAPRALLALSIAGNMIVLLGWFGSVTNEFQKPMASWVLPVLLLLLGLHLVSLTAGMAPVNSKTRKI